METSLGEIAKLVDGAVIGDAETRITGFNSIRQAETGELTFVAHERYIPLMAATRASAILVPRNIAEGAKPLVQVDSPYEAFLRLIQHLRPPKMSLPKGIHPTAMVAASAEIGPDAALGPHVVVSDGARIGAGTIVCAGCYIGRDTSIGEATLVYPNVSIREEVTVGARCIIHSGAVIGSDGFGFASRDGVHVKIPQTGTVVIGDDVEIGANSAVDRATFGATRIGSGTKIDNLVQIGHNVVLGEHCIVCGTSGIAGSAVIEDHVTIGAQAGINGHIEIGRGVTVGARSGVTKSVKPGQVVSGFPATDHNREKRILASLRHLPEYARRIRQLERRIQELEELLHGKAADNS